MRTLSCALRNGDPTGTVCKVQGCLMALKGHPSCRIEDRMEAEQIQRRRNQPERYSHDLGQNDSATRSTQPSGVTGVDLCAHCKEKMGPNIRKDCF